MKVAIAADHAGYALKSKLIPVLEQAGFSLSDMGTFTSDPVDYPDYARRVADAVREGAHDRGILICGSGVGASIAANKFPGIRAALCHDTFSARQGVEDDDMNVLCLGARVIGEELAKEIVRAFLRAEFSGKERHRRRLDKVKAIEMEFMNNP